MSIGSSVVLIALLIPTSVLAQESPDCPDGRSTFSGITLSTTYAVGSRDLAAIVLESLDETGFTVEGSTFSHDIKISSAPRFTWTQGSEDEDWHGDDHPGVQASIQLTPTVAGDSTEFSVYSTVICKVTGPDPDADIESMVSLMAALEISAKVGEKLDER